MVISMEIDWQIQLVFPNFPYLNLILIQNQVWAWRRTLLFGNYFNNWSVVSGMKCFQNTVSLENSTINGLKKDTDFNFQEFKFDYSEVITLSKITFL